MARRRKRWVLGLLVGFLEVVVLGVAFFGLHMARNLDFHSQPPSAQWSRHLGAGTGDMSIAPGADTLRDGSLFTNWVTAQGIGYARVSPQGAVELTGTLALGGTPAPLRSASLVRIPLQREDIIDFFWVEAAATPVLKAAGVDREGRLTWGPQTVLEAVRTYCVATSRGPGAAPPRLVVAQDGTLTVFSLPPSAPPQPLGQPLEWGLLRQLDGKVDRAGVLHLLVTSKTEDDKTSLSYLTQDAPGTWGAPAEVAKLRVFERQTLRCPRLGLDLQRAYVFYTLEDTRPATGKATTFYFSFPLDAPEAVQPQKLVLQTDLMGAPSETVNDCWLSPGQARALDLAVTCIVGRTRLRRYQDIVTLTFKDGQPGPPSAACLTRGASLSPVLARTPDGADQYLTWLDTAGFGRYRITVASTGAGFVHRLNRRTAGDWWQALLDTFMNVGLSLGMVFVAAFWLTLPLVMVGVGHFVSLDWAERRPWPLALAAIAVHLAGKMYYVFRSFYQSPLTTLAMPVWMKAGPAAYILPAALCAVAGLNLWRHYRAHTARSPISLYGRFALVDTIITLVLYSPFIMT